MPFFRQFEMTSTQNQMGFRNTHMKLPAMARSFEYNEGYARCKSMTQGLEHQGY